MGDVKQILVVDDHFEMLEFLRSMLELSNESCEVLAVPSAEEGMLEIRRAKFDLVISDVRLPGMSGLEFVRRMRRLGYETPVIMITAYTSEQGRAEADELGVFRYFAKPLDTDDVLTAVHKALHGDSMPVQLPTAPSAAASQPNDSLLIQRRLETLRTDTGAIQLILASKEGKIILSTGDSDLDLHSLATIIARNINDSFLLADMLGTAEPFSLQYHAGDYIELYCANVGETHFVTLFFDPQARRGRIGTIWVFTQRAIGDLQLLLTDGTPNTAVSVSPPPIDKPLPVAEPKITTAAPVSEPEPDEPLLQLDPLDVSEGELEALFSSAPPAAAEVDLEAFWSDALVVEEQDSSPMLGLSLEEAKEQGLFSTEQLEEDEDS